MSCLKILYDANKGFRTVMLHFSEVHDIYPKLENIPVQNILFPIAEQALNVDVTSITGPRNVITNQELDFGNATKSLFDTFFALSD